MGEWIDNLVNPAQLPTLLEDAVTKMHTSGLPKNAKIFVAAHSLGGEKRLRTVHLLHSPKREHSCYYAALFDHSIYWSASCLINNIGSTMHLCTVAVTINHKTAYIKVI